jgi:hypothetical protein
MESADVNMLAALLFAWHLHPETFTQMDSIDTILEQQSKA